MMVFAIIAFVGLFFLVVSAVLGGHEGFAEHEVSFEEGYEADGGFDGPSPYSFKVIALFMTAFGAIGAIARYYTATYMVSSLVGVAGGLFFGFIGWQIMRLFWKQQASSTIRSKELADAVGVVKTAIPESGTGEISIELKQQRLYLPARSKDGRAVPEGAQVKVVANPGGAIIVEKVEQGP